MSGHNKWSTIKHKKARTDAQRSKAWTKIVRELIVAARDGGGDPEFNSSLRLAIQKAKSVNMPKDNIKRAIKRGSGELGGAAYESVTYEGYGPEGVAILVRALTDNRNRTAAEVRSLFSKNHGTIGEPGSVAWQFERKGLVTISANEVDGDELMMVALEIGADDIETGEEAIEVTSEPTSLAQVTKGLEEAGYEVTSSEFTWIAQNTVDVDGTAAKQTVRLWQALEDNDDVQSVYLNADIEESLLAELMG